ncbi:MAG: PRC-barrel domain-containing protein [Alphaproteobacteria bacterium]|nr:PRC-barrel domain-containing protein [Alphaproteobacteria bacterium]
MKTHKLAIGASALALSMAIAGAPALAASADDAAKTRAEQGAAATGNAIEEGARATGNAVETAAEATGRTARNMTNGLREVSYGGASFTTPERGSFSARELLGTDIYGPRADVVAKVEDAWMNESGEVTGIVADRGGFLGIGDEELALEADEVTFTQTVGGDVVATTQLTEAQFEQAADTRYSAPLEIGADADAYEGLTLEDDLLGRSVVNQTGEDIATVRDALVSRDGKITHLILAYGGLLGFGGQLTAIEFPELTFEQGGSEGAIVLNMGAADFQNRPEFRYNLAMDQAE